MKKQAFILRISPSGIDRTQEALSSNQLIIGWSKAKGLQNRELTKSEFKDIIRKCYYDDDENMRRTGAATGHMWRFIRDMKIGDFVVTPSGSEFYVAKVTRDATYSKSKITDDTTYRRSVVWLNSKKPIPRSVAKSALISRMKAQGTCTSATDLLDEIEECLDIAKAGDEPDFYSDLEKRLIEETLDEILEGRVDDFGFENLIKDVLNALGATEVRIVPRRKDVGADIVATFLVAGAIPQTVAVQAKYWDPDPPVGKEVVQQLINGIEAEAANLGMMITSGKISSEATNSAEEYFEKKGIRIELIDGEQFAKMVVESIGKL